VTTVVGGVALTLITLVCLHEQRVFRDLSDQRAAYGQLRDAEALLPIDVRAASSVSGDVRDARDTSLELRGIVASAVVCDTTASAIVLAPDIPGAESYASLSSTVAAGDTAWVLAASDSAETWRPYRVSSSISAGAGPCSPPGPALATAARATSRIALTLDSLPLVSALGAPLRVTRPFRYSLYRGTDGDWYLGQRDWNAAMVRFNSVQPVSGPFLSPASGGLVFTYLDSSGTSLATPVTNTRRIASVRVDLRSATRFAPRALASAPQRGPRVDSAALWILIRNRR
ncbi:MAG: hypothetical protein ACREPM_00855, partial [Gemmatimonadaceae bacterium]